MRTLLIAALSALPATLAAQDVMTVAREHYRVLVENADVRVVENTLKPGEKDPMHTHPAGWYIVTAPGRMKVVTAAGKTEVWAPKLHESAWMNAEGAHTSENIGTTPMTYILVEVKSAAKP